MTNTKPPVNLTKEEAACLKSAVLTVWAGIGPDVMAMGEMANDECIEQCVDCDRLKTDVDDGGQADALFSKLSRIHGYLPLLDAIGKHVSLGA
jgi:hypothetical protein